MKHFKVLINCHGDFYSPPRPLQGRGGILYGQAFWNPLYNALVCRLPEAEWTVAKHKDVLATAQHIGNVWAVADEFETEDGKAFASLADAINHEKGIPMQGTHSNVVPMSAPISRELIIRSPADRLRHIAQGLNLPQYRKYTKREDMEKALFEFCGYGPVMEVPKPPEATQQPEAAQAG